VSDTSWIPGAKAKAALRADPNLDPSVHKAGSDGMDRGMFPDAIRMASGWWSS
jgi:hypothetical protein